MSVAECVVQSSEVFSGFCIPMSHVFFVPLFMYSYARMSQVSYKDIRHLN